MILVCFHKFQVTNIFLCQPFGLGAVPSVICDSLLFNFLFVVGFCAAGRHFGAGPNDTRPSQSEMENVYPNPTAGKYPLISFLRSSFKHTTTPLLHNMISQSLFS